MLTTSRTAAAAFWARRDGMGISLGGDTDDSNKGWPDNGPIRQWGRPDAASHRIGGIAKALPANMQ